MSNSQLMKWFESLLFGDVHVSEDPPDELRMILLRMEFENIPWFHIIKQGGFTAFPYQVHGDLNYLLHHLENDWLPIDIPALKTKAVSRFWKQFQLIMSRREVLCRPLKPEQEDDEILKKLIDHQPASESYQSASFWGEVARRYINLKRPINSPVPLASLDTSQRVAQLYNVTCQARGKYWDPFSLHLIPHDEYVDAVHWQSPDLLEAFMLAQPDHILTHSIQKLMRRAFKQFFNGQSPLSYSWPDLDALLHNINVIHANVREVPHENEPPKLVDVFQRLLALCHKDHIWEKEVYISEIDKCPGTDQFLLTERLMMAQRQNQFMWERSNEIKSLVKPFPNTC